MASFAIRLVRGLVLGSLSLCGCATVFDNGPDPVRMTSEPEGAEVILEGVSVGRTPVTCDVGRGTKFVEFALPGHVSTKMKVDRKFNDTSLLSAFMGLLPLLVDVSTDCWKKARTSTHAVLRRQASGSGVLDPDSSGGGRP